MSEKLKSYTAEDLRVPWSTALLFYFFVFFIFNLWQTVHERWIVKSSHNPLTGQLQVDNYNVDVVIIGLGILLFIAIVLFVLRFKQMWRFLTSMQLGIALTGAVTIGTILGTLVFQNAPDQDYIKFYSEPMFMVFKALHLTDVFSSWWFLSTEVLLAVSLVAITIRIKPWSLGKIGLAATHLGVVLVIFGAFLGAIMHVEGAILLGEGDTTNFIVSEKWVKQNGDNLEKILPVNVPKEYQIPLEGAITLDKFDELYYDEPYILQQGHTTTRIDVRTGEEQQVVRAETGIDVNDKKPVMLKGGLGKIQILKVFRNYLRTEKLVPDDKGQPLAIVEVTNTGHDHAQGEEAGHSHSWREMLRSSSLDNPVRGTSDAILPASDDPMTRFTTPNNTFRLRYSWLKPDDAKLKELEILDAPAPFIIMARSMTEEASMNSEHLEARLKPGVPTPLGSSGYTLTLVKFYNHLNVKLQADGTSVKENASDLMENPSIDVSISGPGYTNPVVLTLSARGAAPNDKAMQEFVQKSNLMMGFIMAPPSDLILVGSTGELLVYQDGSLKQTVDLRNESYMPQYTSLSLKLLQAVEKGRVDVSTSDDNPVKNYAVEVSFTGKDGKQITQTLELLTDDVTREQIMNDPNRYYLTIDDKNQVTFIVRGDYIKDWVSHLSISKDGTKVLSHNLRVNEPLIYNGYYFYQSDWYPKPPYGTKPEKWYTYLRVNYDAGVFFVYLGIAGLVFGTIYHFYLAPFFRRKENGEVENGVKES